MSESAFKRPPRMTPDVLEDLLQRIGMWMRAGNIAEPGWFTADHPNSTAEWAVRVDVEFPLGQARWGHSETTPLDPEVLAALASGTSDGFTDADDEPLPAVLLRWEVEDALDELPREERQCLEAVVFGRMSVRQAADMLGMSYPTVWRRVQSAKDKLAERLGHHDPEFTHQPANDDV